MKTDSDIIASLEILIFPVDASRRGHSAVFGFGVFFILSYLPFAYLPTSPFVLLKSAIFYGGASDKAMLATRRIQVQASRIPRLQWLSAVHNRAI